MTNTNIPAANSIIEVDFDVTARAYITFEDDDGNLRVAEYKHVKTEDKDEFSGVPP